MEPAYQIPLDDTQLALLGKLSAIWSQMDYFLLAAISNIMRINLRDCEVILNKTTVGARIGIFKKLTSSLHDEKLKKQSELFSSQVNKILGMRNHLTHGIWGLFSSDGNQKYVSACYHPENKKGLIYASELTEIIQLATSVNNILIDFVTAEYPLEIQNLTNRELCMGYGPPEGRYQGSPGSLYLDLAALGHSPN